MSYVLVNSEAASFYRSRTDSFIGQREYYRYVCNDYVSSSVSNGVVRLQFQPAGQRPVIVIINAVTNSPSHKPYELLINEGHYSQTDYSEDVLRWRHIIDSVEAPPPVLLLDPLRLPENGDFHFTIDGTTGRNYLVESSTNFVEWSVIASNLMDGSIVQDTNAAAYPQRFYRVRQ